MPTEVARSTRAWVMALAVVLLATTAHAEEVNTGRGRLGLKGYDPVAYFSEGRPVKGDPNVTVAHAGVTYRFATARSRDRFAESPERYLPQYGGFCAWAVSRGYTADIDPHAWKVVDGKLYLNYSQSVARHWAQDIPGNISRADANWPALRRK